MSLPPIPAGTFYCDEDGRPVYDNYPDGYGRQTGEGVDVVLFDDLQRGVADPVAALAQVRKVEEILAGKLQELAAQRFDLQCQIAAEEVGLRLEQVSRFVYRGDVVTGAVNRLDGTTVPFKTRVVNPVAFREGS